MSTTPSPHLTGNWKLGPFVVNSNISVTGILALVAAMLALIGGWYRFDYRQTADEQRIQLLEDEHKQEIQIHVKLDHTLTTTNNAMGAILQALEDKGIHVRTPSGSSADDDSP